MSKPRLHVVNTEKTIDKTILVESSPVYKLFEVSKSTHVERDADLLYTQTYGASDVIHTLQVTRKPYVVHMGGDPWSELEEMPNRLNAVRHILRRAKLVIANSLFLYQVARSNGVSHAIFLPGGLWGFDESPLGVNPRRFKKKENYALGNPLFVLMAISLRVPKKYLGIEVFMRAMQSVQKRSEVRFVCAGEAQESAFKSRMRRKYNVEFPGRLEDWPELLPQADLFVHPSLYDCFPRALAEAKCAGVPALSFRAAGNTTVGDSPVYVDPRKPREIFDAFNLLIREEGLREYLGFLGRSHALQKTALHRADYAAILQEVLHGREAALIKMAEEASRAARKEIEI